MTPRRTLVLAVVAATTLLVACGGSNESASVRTDGTGRDPGSAIQPAQKESDVETDFYALDLPDGWQHVRVDEVLTAGGTSADELRESAREEGIGVDTSGLKDSVTLVPPGVELERPAVDEDPDDPQIIYAVVPLGRGVTAAAGPAASASTAEQLATALEGVFGSGIERRPSTTSLDGAPTVIVGERQLVAAHEGRLFSLAVSAGYMIPEHRLEDVGRDLRMLAKGWSWE